MDKLRFFLFSTILVMVHLPACGQSSDSSSGSLVLLNYIAWWAHDDRAITLQLLLPSRTKLARISLIRLLRFQARFIEIKNNYLSVARDDIRRVLAKGGQSQPETLVGSEPYELSIDVNSWPQIECKVLYKLVKKPKPTSFYSVVCKR